MEVVPSSDLANKEKNDFKKHLSDWKRNEGRLDTLKQPQFNV